ncbi:hypothetical protein [Glaciihabitans sp. UYNi722]|uniref:hypothetical protein n=1 Tax=Glaciihabitans sp. UYNi722 TaxID=3156344 RepID=UPI003398F402
MIYLLSNNTEVGLTPEALRKLAQEREPQIVEKELPAYQIHRLERRLSAEQVEEIVLRYSARESTRSLAKEFNVAPSALIRLLRERNVVVRQQVVTAEQETTMAREYEAGATMAELEQEHELSHGAVLRALHRSGVEMRAKAPRRKSV